MEKKNFNEVLKAREAAEAASKVSSADEPMHLDDTQRVKVLSPGQLVFKRFMRNKLAIVGSCILIFMFLFSFVGPLLYPYGQTEIFYKFDYLTVNYASATQRTEYTNFVYDSSLTVEKSVSNKATSMINSMESAGETVHLEFTDDGSAYVVEMLGEFVYTISPAQTKVAATLGFSEAIGSYNKMFGEMTYLGETLDADFITAVDTAITRGTETFSYDGADYTVTAGTVKNTYDVVRGAGDGFAYPNGTPSGDFEAAYESREGNSFSCDGSTFVVKESADGSTVYQIVSAQPAIVCSTLVFDMYDTTTSLSDDAKANILMALYGDGVSETEGTGYTTVLDDETFMLYANGASEPIALLSDFSVRRYSGEDSLPVEFKAVVSNVITEMEEAGVQEGSFVYALPELDETGAEMVDENGNTVTIDTDITVTRKTGQYVLTCDQLTHLIDIYAPSSSAHIFGTDADGMDVLARMMYGGRISLMVGFVVVILECFLGVILGGIAGYFGKWVDTLIMRMVDVFYCIPSMPILIILGAFFDNMRLSSYMRLIWMMAVLGFLGWAGIARLVRGQILSLREQEFMTATEATGISVSRRIFRHLIPNVMPQLIVNATMGLGSVIITESTLSFLGLGVKHPLATWGTMINSITSSNENLVRYAYIWIPIGCLICLTVIAFNFVGDGLRDAFDPKMKQ